jgi:hypothetical protein
MRKLAATGLSLVIAGVGLAGATVASAAPLDSTVVLTSQQLTEAGFPKKPNTVAWDPGTASLPTNTAAQWQDVIITGKAPSYTSPGQILTMSRFLASDTKGSGTQKPLNITAVVQKDRSFTMHFQLGLTGTWGYVVGYSTTGDSPEYIGFQFQFTTTGSGKPAPSAGSSTAVTLGSKKLANAGFTKTANTTAWAGTATLSTSKAKAGAPVTISGTTTAPIKPGTVLTLNRFTPTDKLGSGSFSPVGSIQTVVAADGSFSLTFEINERGLYGYDLLAQTDGEEAIIVEFQLKTT